MDQSERPETKQKKGKPGRPKGQPKTGGRKKGTPNKSRVFLKDMLADAGFDFARELSRAFAELPPETRLQGLKEMLPWLAPRLTDKDVPLPSPEGKADDADEESTADLLKIVRKS